jgi:hypothetical protein
MWLACSRHRELGRAINAETGKAIEIADRGGMPRAGGGRLAERRMCEAGAIVLN